MMFGIDWHSWLLSRFTFKTDSILLLVRDLDGQFFSSNAACDGLERASDAGVGLCQPATVRLNLVRFAASQPSSVDPGHVDRIRF